MEFAENKSMEKPKYKDLLFDVDGTLLDFAAAEEHGLRQVFAPFGDLMEPMTEAYQILNKQLWEDFEKGLITKEDITQTRFRRIFKKFGVDADGVETEARYRQCLNRCAILIDGALEVLDYLRPKYNLYVVTNGFVQTQKMRMKDSGLEPYFIRSFISEEIGCQKPGKEFFDYCMNHIEEADRRKMLIIGDSLTSDMKGGEMAGIDTCWYNPQRKENLDQVKLTMEIEDLRQLMKKL